MNLDNESNPLLHTVPIDQQIKSQNEPSASQVKTKNEVAKEEKNGLEVCQLKTS